jgi:hypothetical protein
MISGVTEDVLAEAGVSSSTFPFAFWGFLVYATSVSYPARGTGVSLK